ncbi:hypothetical protein HY410_00525 [Candidatus Gottesmanbacteria bacterium]|nr:hypothetical protein [Candidatus Gottesmanbacteria bacterium]
MLDWLLTHSPLLYLTQSLWRDEAYSALMAQRPISWIVQSVTFEPPVYYTLLHYWTRIFGTSEIALRSLSLLGFALATGVVIHWSEKLFRKSWLSILLPLLFFLNPMLLYYAFEVRTYGWYIFFATLSMYAYHERRWRLYMGATILGFYTHSYFLIVPMVQVVHWLLTNKLSSQRLRDPFFLASVVNGLFIAPWLIRLAGQAGKLKDSWYFPVDFHLIRSSLGNMFLGYEGTPWYLWDYTAALSVALILLFAFAARPKESRGITFYFLLSVFLPLALIIGISFIKPLFVNRYLIPVAIAEVFLLAYATSAIGKRSTQYLVGLSLIGFSIGFNLWYPKEHQKINIRRTIMEINTLARPDDVVLATSPLVLFETIYYSTNPSRVYLYNPSGSPFPWYVGDTLFDKNKIAVDLPPYPVRAFLVHQDGSYDIAYRTNP